MFKTQTWDGEWVVSPEKKLNNFAEYYGDLNTSDNPSAHAFENFFPLFMIPQTISLEQRGSMDAPIHLQEVIMATDTLKRGKTPGPDGFSSEFYKMFKLILAPILYKVFTLIFEAEDATILV